MIKDKKGQKKFDNKNNEYRSKELEKNIKELNKDIVEALGSFNFDKSINPEHLEKRLSDFIKNSKPFKNILKSNSKFISGIVVPTKLRKSISDYKIRQDLSISNNLTKEQKANIKNNQDFTSLISQEFNI